MAYIKTISSILRRQIIDTEKGKKLVDWRKYQDESFLIINFAIWLVCFGLFFNLSEWRVTWFQRSACMVLTKMEIDGQVENAPTAHRLSFPELQFKFKLCASLWRPYIVFPFFPIDDSDRSHFTTVMGLNGKIIDKIEDVGNK